MILNPKLTGEVWTESVEIIPVDEVRRLPKLQPCRGMNVQKAFGINVVLATYLKGARNFTARSGRRSVVLLFQLNF